MRWWQTQVHVLGRGVPIQKNNSGKKISELPSSICNEEEILFCIAHRTFIFNCYVFIYFLNFKFLN